MAGTKSGGQAAAETNRKKYGPDFYAKIGAKGGRNGHTGGFHANRELAATAGAIGGTRSRRGPAQPKAGSEPNEAYLRAEAAIVDARLEKAGQ
jgi:general stress protein YciG